MKNSKLVSIVVPVFNEEANIDPFVREVGEVFQELPYDYQILFVDDGSKDGTPLKIRELARKESRVKGLSLSRNFGSHSAITAGLLHAQGDAVVIMAVDLQDPPEVIRDFISKWEEGHEVVWGVRKNRQDAKGRMFLTAIFYRLLRKIALPDYPVEGTGSFCLIDKKVQESIGRFEERNRVIFGLISWAGFKQTLVYYNRPSRQQGKSKWRFRKLVKTGIDVFTAYSYVPVRISAYMGILFLLVSLATILYVVANWYFKRDVVPGWSTLMISIFALGGAQLLSLGIIGEYIWRISEEVKNRPNFILRDRIGF
jgi:dolichol-phosphate mannosyltransferase